MSIAINQVQGYGNHKGNVNAKTKAKNQAVSQRKATSKLQEIYNKNERV